ncbi:hypothetical protein TIFTF001_003873 [Ficus carica]|uniref:Uncharacterized protein n=1 Tax=Ficus carica TaxID=3494 RepID=A0AA87ZVM8_FICCA|nr:hypothetical protein TIFTF001_003873 [Ficus carica]
MAITKRAAARNTVEERPVDQNDEQANGFQRRGSEDLDLSQAVRVLMEKLKITDETQKSMRDNQRTLETQLEMARLENEILKSRM